MKKRGLFLCATAALGCGSAAAYTIDDTGAQAYWGADARTYGDIIGSGALFEIYGADVSMSGSVITVDIHTNLAGRADEGLFAGYTNTLHGEGRGIGFGDLFFASDWQPFGIPDHYADDDHATGTNWSYGFSIDDNNRWTDTGGTGTLYALTGSNAADALLTGDFMSGAIYRDGQEVAVDRDSATTVSTGVGGTFSVTPDTAQSQGGILSFSVDIGGTSLWLPGELNEIAIHWAMSCGNDTVEGSTFFRAPPPNVGVPEPASLGLALLGLAGAAGARLRDRPR
ncbi:MAG: PEP-CTERM sorting domain-containing protein [Gammaproteobacteria bacterium]